MNSNLTVDVSPAANRDYPVAVDLLVVYDEELLESLEKKSAREWFESREQYLKNLAATKQLDVHSWEWVSGLPRVERRIAFRRGAKGGLLFADYFSEGEHRARFDPGADLRVTLGEVGFSLVQ